MLFHRYLDGKIPIWASEVLHVKLISEVREVLAEGNVRAIFYIEFPGNL